MVKNLSMTFIADLHIHSRFSRATAKTLNFENLYMAARQKGISVIATGDCTHPEWMAEIRDNLEPAEDGLLKLKEDRAAACEQQLCLPVKRPVRFMINGEIATIYKKNGVTRKLHHLVFFPGLHDADRFNARLSGIGNLKSDGRPILGLDSRDLLEITLESSADGFLIPAHIWTPWFSLFGSKSGFDTIAECFADLSDHIFAAETGLSSDPPMNWRVGELDGITLISNSDAHSPANLGREANLFHTQLSYAAMREAMATGDPNAFGGTLEFFPQEGKYHADGHRKCGINLTPAQTMAQGGICPVCGQPVTVGVLYRVEQLATRPDGEKPPLTHPFFSLIPLAEVFSELLKVGPKSKKVARTWQSAIETLGPELDILLHLPTADIAAAGFPLLSEAVGRMREGRVHVQAGFDGQYGRVTIFTQQQRDALIGQQSLFCVPADQCGNESAPPIPPPEPTEPTPTAPQSPPERATAPSYNCDPADAIVEGLNPAQKTAVMHPGGPLLIVAGPGTGKTRTLTRRIAWLLQNRAAAADAVLAVTFTNKAAREMAERIGKLTAENAALPRVATFHALCFDILKTIENTQHHGIIDDIDRRVLIAEAIKTAPAAEKPVTGSSDAVLDCIVAAKQRVLSPEDDLSAVAGDFDAAALAAVYAAYQDRLAIEGLYDYEDLIYRVVMHFAADADLLAAWQERFRHIFIDEYQDLNYAQYRLVRQLMPDDGEICVIGDPDQSIYSFRGADAAFFKSFIHDYPAATVIDLSQNYRSSETILSAAEQVIAGHSINDRRGPLHSGIAGEPHIGLLTAQTEHGEAVAIGKTIEALIGGMGFAYHDFGNTGAENGKERAFSDFAVLYRTRAQGDVLAEVFDAAGIAYQRARKENAYGETGIREVIAALKIVEGVGSYADLQCLLERLAPAHAQQAFQTLSAWGYQHRLSLPELLAATKQRNGKDSDETDFRQLACLSDLFSDLSEKTAGLTAAEKLETAIDTLGPQLPAFGRNQTDTLRALRQLARDCGTNGRAMIETLMLQADPDFVDVESQKVALMTIHAAKGLEFPVVFLAGCEDGLLPFRRDNRAGNPAEERRLFYVAVTRAEQALYLCRARQRKTFGRVWPQHPSPFLADIDDRLLADATGGGQKKKQVQLKLFS
ncbi:MAG: UvrD-helicase domain-containing protein [Thermodesulfobacteriota bacterium]